MGIVEQYLLQLNTKKQRFRRSVLFLSVLSLLVILTVSWNLRQTGIAIANDACCGYQEHQHTEACPMEKVLICSYASEAQPDMPTEETIDETLETFTETATEESSEAPTEEATEAPTEVPAEAEMEVPAEAEMEAPSEAETEATTESVMEIVANAAADLISEIIPEVHASDVPEEETTPEHIHSEACYEISWLCGLEEHIHEFACYSDLTADLEDWDIWAASIPELTGRISEDIVLVAQAQLGLGESTLNFELAEDGETHNGITRYGQWYGNPYGPWSNMFTSFCLRYAGLTSVPINSGAEKMMLDWEAMSLYRHAGGYEPVAGDIVFLDKNQNGTPESTGVVVRYFDFILTVIEGDVDNAVVQREYRIDDPVINGYGITNAANRVMMFAANSSKTIGQTANYTYPTNLLGNGGTFIVYTTGSDGKQYAIDGNGDAVQITITNGVISAAVAEPMMLYWNFTVGANYDNRPAYFIKNVATGRYLHPNRDTGNAGSLHTGEWRTALYTSGAGVRFRGTGQDAYSLLSGDKFTYTRTQSEGSIFYFGRTPAQVSLWLDGTNGNIMRYRGSDNTRYTVYNGVEMKLPTEWKSPRKYQYKLAGWVNVATGDYYAPGSMISVTKDTVLYADWVANTYDVGEYNSHVVDTVSTDDFITTHVFDYSSLINLLSTQVSVNVSGSGHTESWSHVDSGKVTYKNQDTLNFSFNDHDEVGTIANLDGAEGANAYTGGTAVYPGIYNSNLGEVLFSTSNLFDPDTGEGIVGKHYLGQGDHLFQIDTNPASDYYGYYYYDAKLNAASYNQSDQRFYVYNYLTRASDSENNDTAKYSDFLPLNSPYANTNMQNMHSYTYAGVNGEYSGVAHYSYDSRYDSNGSDANRVMANMWFGMRMDIHFGLPDTPGERLNGGNYGNKDIYGNDMHFYFTGDDDVWILIDGKVILDLGGIHQEAVGEINFSTGEVWVNGASMPNLSGITEGEHTLSILYLERGSSMANCGIYFNLAPRYSLTLQKEDVLTQQLLNGAEFQIFYDQECTQLCDLWSSQKAYKDGEAPLERFAVKNGKVYIWGFSPARTYYIKEVTPPSATGYPLARGVIKLTLDKNGLNSYSATVLEELDEYGNPIPISNGFTVHGFRIDEINQAAYVSITNAQTWVKDTTEIYVDKQWNDNKDHTYDSVTVYLNVTDSKGTRKLREITLSKENNWQYRWVNLPRYEIDPTTGLQSTTPVQYSVSEAFKAGYTYSIVDLGSSTPTTEWNESTKFVNGEVYVLKTNYNQGCLSAVSASTGTLCFVDEATAKESSLALWKATIITTPNGDVVQLKNLAGQSLLFERDGWKFRVSTGDNYSGLTVSEVPGQGLNLALINYYQDYTETLYICHPYGDGYLGGSGTPLIFNPLVKSNSSSNDENDGYGYRIVNTPLTRETSLKVTKLWDAPTENTASYEKAQITIKLMANKLETGRTVTLSKKNNWTAVFSGLPYTDGNGNPIAYTVLESWDTDDWIPIYGEVTTISGRVPTYETTVTNRYRWTNAFELPSTGGIGYPLLILIGVILVTAPFVYGFRMRRRYRKGASS